MKSLLRALVLLACVPFAAACDDYQYRFFGAAPSPVPVRLASSPFGIFRGDGSVISITGPRSCNVGMTTGDTRAGVQWRVSGNTGAILFEQNAQTLQTGAASSFSGVITGVDFTANTASSGNVPQTSCLFLGGSLSGRFSADFSTFDAVENLSFGQPGAEIHVQRHWVGTRES